MPDGIENKKHIQAIEDHVSGINAHIELLMPTHARQIIAKEQAAEDMNDFQVGTLHDLKILFEGD